MSDSGEPIHVTLRCFAAVREALGAEELRVELQPGTTAGALRQRLGEATPALLRVPVAYAVNRDYAQAETVLRDGDEVAFIPPISGGGGGALFEV